MNMWHDYQEESALLLIRSNQTVTTLLLIVKTKPHDLHITNTQLHIQSIAYPNHQIEILKFGSKNPNLTLANNHTLQVSTI